MFLNIHLSCAAMAGAAPGEVVAVSVQWGKTTLSMSLPPAATAAQLKALLEVPTGVVARNQTLIHKGKMLADVDKISACGRLLLLAKGAPGGGASAPAAAAPPPPPADAGRSSSKRAPLPAQRAAAWRATGLVGLRDANLVEIPAEVWALGPSCRVLDCSGNPRLGAGGGLPPAAAALSGLTRLSLSACGLCAANVAWSALSAAGSSLASLRLDRNLLDGLPDGLLPSLPALTELCLAGNRLAALPAGVGALSQLRTLDCSDNALAALPPELGDCAALEAVDASGNQLCELPAELGRCRKLATLRADRNPRLRALPRGLLAGAAALHTLSLHGCGVGLEALREADGFQGFERRRRARCDKALAADVLGAADFDEGADAARRRYI